MSFENARITAQEYAEYGLAAVDAKYLPMMNCSSQWTIDRKRDIHARRVSRTVPPEMGPRSPFWLLFWKHDYAIFECEIHQHATGENAWSAHKSLVRLELPQTLAPNKVDIIKDIEALLRTYGTGGIYCIASNYRLTFDVRV